MISGAPRASSPVTNVHMMGDIEVMGDGGLEWLKDTAALGARCAVATTTNARCFDFAHCERLGQDAGEAAKERELIACLRRMDVVTTDTCINYQTVYQPHLGEHVAWGDTGTVIYANSVFGARSNFESGPAALAAAITGRTPEYGFHLDAAPQGQLRGRTAGDARRPRRLGRGRQAGGRIAPELFLGAGVPRLLRARRPRDELKHLGAALASYGSMGMFHFVGVTPEAPSLEAALGGRTPAERMVITDADIERAYAGYRLGDGDARLVVFSGPQQSLFEMKQLAGLFDGRKVKAGSRCFVTTNGAVLAQSRALGYAGTLEAGGRHDPRGRVLLHPAEPFADAGGERLEQPGVQFGEDREHHRRAPLQLPSCGARGIAWTSPARES